MDVRITDVNEPSHIHVPRPSRIARHDLPVVKVAKLKPLELAEDEEDNLLFLEALGREACHQA